MKLRPVGLLLGLVLLVASPAALQGESPAGASAPDAAEPRDAEVTQAESDVEPGSQDGAGAPEVEETDGLSEEPRGTLARIWHLRLMEFGGQTIRISNVVVGLILVTIGLLLARHLARLICAVILSRVRISPGASAAVESILFYVMLVVVAYSALAVANVPLTAFTLLGGAAAIGVGFGSQTLVSNFIAGLILLLEQPIRAGDLIQIDDLFGNVVRVGARSTRVQTGDNVELLVPNAVFLEQRIVNWTLSNSRVRIPVSVGVAYGSPTEEVARLIRQALDEHPKVHEEPEPIVLFTEFGDNALGFEAHFWIDMQRMMERRIIESDLRFRIDALFREAGITIAFPQRDVHLDTLRPLDVRLVQGADQPGSA